MDAATVIALPALTDLGIAEVSAGQLNRLVSTAVGRPAQVTSLTVTPVDYPSGSIATGALLRCAGSAVDVDGECLHWRIFVKVLRSARKWPMLHVIPTFARQQWIDEFPWRIEIDAYRSAIAPLLDAGMRLPAIYDVIDIDEDHAAVWMEDVIPSPASWDDDTFARAARHLGVLAGRRPLGTSVVFGPAQVVATCGYAMRMFAQGRLFMGAAPQLRDPASWQHPALAAALVAAGETTMPAELVAALDRIDPWLDAMDALPQTYVHGDASPQNLLVPADDPGSYVVIDFSFNSPQCVGFDLGQLLMGLVHAGEMAPEALDRVRRAIVPAYLDGLRSVAPIASAAEVERGFLLATVTRSLFTAIPFESLDEPDDAALERLLADRIRLTRYLLTLAAELPDDRAMDV